MTRDNSSATATKKPALVLTPDGEIEGHVVPEQAGDTTASEREIVYVPYEATKDGQQIRRFINRHTMHILLSNLAVAILVGLYFHFSSSEEQGNSIATIDKVEAVSAPKIVQEPFAELKANAKGIIQDQQWDIGRINRFVDNWRSLDEPTQLSLANSFWFEQFTDSLVEKVNLQQIPASSIDQEKAAIYKGALLNMAALVGVDGLEQNPFSAPMPVEADIVAGENPIAEQPEPATDDSLQAPDQIATGAGNIDASDQPVNSTATPGKDETDLTNIVAELSTEIAKVEANHSSSSTPQEIPEEKLAPLPKDKQAAIGTPKKSVNGFSESDLHFLLGQYATTYEFGDTKKLLKLFSADPEYRNALERSFNKVFSYSKKRHIEFSDLEWQFFKHTIVGTGKYKATIDLKNNRGTRFVNANIKVKMLAGKNQLSISRLDFSRVKSKVVKPKQKVKSKPNSRLENKSKKTQARVQPKAPTAAELQDVVTRFVGAYETGNLNALDSVFSENARTNDKNSLSEIKKDYRNFFTSTTDRQLFIKNLKWSYDHTYAKGIGNMNALVVAMDGDKIDNIKGEIQIVARRLNNKVLITHLYHNYRSN